MQYAWICMSVVPGREFEVLNYLKRVPEIIEAHVLYGLYDLIAKVEVNQLADLKTIVFDQLVNIPYLKSTSTMLVQT